MAETAKFEPSEATRPHRALVGGTGSLTPIRFRIVNGSCQAGGLARCACARVAAPHRASARVAPHCP